MTTKAEVLARLGEEIEEDSYCGHEYLWGLDQIKDVLFYEFDDSEGWAAYNLFVIVSLVDGGFGYMASWADTTGHGCRCDVQTVVEPTIHALLSHLTEYEVIHLFAEPVRDDVDW